jgi:ferredoxin
VESNIKVTFILNDESEKTVYGKIGQSLLDLAHENGLENELIGSCDHSLACSTCHVVVGDNWYENVGSKCEKSYLEEDMLDLAFGLEKTSRLGCQIILCEEFDGLVVKIPNVRIPNI